MYTSHRFILLGACVAAALAYAVGTASAKRIQLSERRFYIIWSALTVEAGLGAVRCPVTLLGSFHSTTISKVCGQLLGHTTHPEINTAACVGGAMRFLTENLPWHFQYRSFAGLLPSITSFVFQTVGARFLVLQFSVSCLYIATQSEPLVYTASISAGQVSALTISGSLTSQTAGCPRANFSGSGAVAVGVENSGVHLVVRLVQ
jgi:hypothetical protein